MGKDEIPCDLAKGYITSPVLCLVPNPRKRHVKCQLRTQQSLNVVMGIKCVMNNKLTFQTPYMLPIQHNIGLKKIGQKKVTVSPLTSMTSASMSCL